jgi:hypothetical protein
MILTIVLVVATAVGVFLFVKNNPKKTSQIDQAAKDVAAKIQDAVTKK